MSRILLWAMLPCLCHAQLTGGSAMLRLRAMPDLSPGAGVVFTPIIMGSEWGVSGRVSLAGLVDGWAGIAGTGEGTMLASWSGSLGSFGALCRISGSAGFGESILGIGYARPLSSSLRVGVRMDRYAVSTPASGKLVGWPVDLAVSWRAGPNLFAGMSVYDPFRVSMPARYGLPPPRVVRVLMGVRLGEGLSLVLEGEAMERRGPTLAVVLSFCYGGRIHVRLGWAGPGSQPLLMMGWQHKGLRVMLGAGWHPSLGERYALSCDWSTPSRTGS